jgi:hypothetical protein
LQSFIAWRLAIEYHLDSRLLYRDREQEYFLGLLGMQFKSSKKVATTKEQITRDLFEPARMLGIPAGKGARASLLWHTTKDNKANMDVCRRCYGSVSLLYTLLCARRWTINVT